MSLKSSHNFESPVPSPTYFPAVAKTEKKGHIPIRSIVYKKSLTEKKDYEVRKEMASTMERFTSSPLFSIPATSPTRASTNYGFKPELSPLNPHMSCTFHKLSLGSAKHSTRKQHTSLLPNLKTSKLVDPNSSLSYMPKTQPNRPRAIKDARATSPQDDYFKLLYDENRKTFKVEECEGVDEYYTDEMIMTRIYKMGFREPSYFGTRTGVVDMTIPDEKSIRDEYRFKIAPVVSTMENDSTLAAHLLGGTWNNIKFIESNIETAAHQIKIIKEEKKQVEKDIGTINQKFEKEVENIMADFAKKFGFLHEVLKEDFVANQNEGFKLQKEIMLLKRDKENLEREIERCVPPLQNMDNMLYGREIFNLESNEPDLQHISTMNLRPEMQMSMKNGQIIH